MFAKIALGLTAVAFTASAASAATTATAGTDLHLRAGPGPNFKIVNVIAADDTVTVEGCLDEANWCRVDYGGQQGWAYGDYLTADLNGEVVAVYPNRTELETVVVENDMAHEEGALAVGAMGAMVGAAAVGGPAAIVVGAILGSATGVAISPEEEVVTYVRENPVEPVFVNGELIVGAGVPQEVEIYSVPDSDVSYVNLNGRYVLVGNDNREIVYIADF